MRGLISGVTALILLSATVACDSDPNAGSSPACPPLSQAAAVDAGTPTAPAAGGRLLTAGAPLFENPPSASPAFIFLPSTLYLLVGQRYRLYFPKFIGGFDSKSDQVEIGVSGAEPEIYRDFWDYIPTAPGSFSISITVRDAAGRLRASESRSAIVTTPRTGSGLRHLSIGDSITRAGSFAELAVQCVLGGKTVGTRTYDQGTVSTEGRGGWTAEYYMTRIAETSGGDSPFLFPVGVRGAQYRGNTAFWRAVTVTDPNGYDYNGFQMIARDWRASGSFPFDTNGYPIGAKLGDVVVDPTLPTEQQWRQYDGSIWTAMNPQPNTGVSLAKYMERYAPAFSSGPPTSISIMLGTVDFLSAAPETLWPTYKSRLDWLIAAIRQWSPNVPIILIGSPSGAAERMWFDQKITGAEFNRRIVDLSRRLYATYDTQEARDKGLYVISFLGVVSDENMADYVHPKVPEGHAQMAPWLAGILSYLISKGAI